MDTHTNKLFYEYKNALVLGLLSNYLNSCPDFIDSDMINEMTDGKDSKNIEYSYALLLSSACKLDIADNPGHMELFREYFLPMVHVLDAEVYKNNPFYKNIHIPTTTLEGWTLETRCLKPYEAFVCKDMVKLESGQIIPNIGFFTEPFEYPAIAQNGQEWMTITPNEIETMLYPIERATGKILTLGLGLGYYAYMVSEKQDTSSVTIVEKDTQVIKLFKTYILPQFPHKEKIEIVSGDALDYIENKAAAQGYDFVFCDLWHDVSDGMDIYIKLKQYERLFHNTAFMYWIEDTLKCYL